MVSIKLKEITNEYRSFIDDQVLTANQLNTMIDYFEDQNRLTRTCLIGVGIVCGLNVSFFEDRIVVSKGCAVTTDGDLLVLNETSFFYTKNYDDRNAQYTRFGPINNILELSNDASDTLILGNSALVDKVAVLYLENYTQQNALCSPTGCDNLGLMQVANLKVLLIDKADVQNYLIGNDDSIFNNNNKIEQYLSLPSLGLARVVLNDSNTTNLGILHGAYKQAILNGNLIGELKKGVKSILSDFNPILKISDQTLLYSQFESSLNSIVTSLSSTDNIDIQYKYDLIKDLIATYEEIKYLIYKLKSSCVPDIDAFPKHIMLGELIPNQDYLLCRHCFYPSESIPHAREKIDALKVLIFKLLKLPSLYATDPRSSTEIRISPSHDYNTPLSDKAIPYYYTPTNELLKSWSYDKAYRYKTLSQYGYHSNAYANEIIISQALNYDLDKFDFFRIEGHLGHDFQDALGNIIQQRNVKGLNFDVVALSINASLEDIDPSKYEAHFEDLEVLYQSWMLEQNCIYSEATSYFSSISTVKDRLVLDIEEIEDHNLVLTAFNNSSYLKNVAAAKPKLDHSYGKKSIVYNALSDKNDHLGKVILGSNALGVASSVGNRAREAASAASALAATNGLTVATSTLLQTTSAMIVYMEELDRATPDSLMGFTQERFLAYSDIIVELKAKANQLINQLQIVISKEEVKPNDHEVMLECIACKVLSQACNKVKLEYLLNEVDRRMQKILSELTLNRFAIKHPGLTHKAGVPDGGTFAILYLGSNKKLVPAEEAEAGPVGIGAGVFNNRFLAREEMFALSSGRYKNFGISNNAYDGIVNPADILVVVNPGDIRIPSFPGNMEVFPGPVGELIPKPPAKPINISSRTVVGDFCLPYRCCEPATMFSVVNPLNSTLLRMPIQSICKEAEMELIYFEVVNPADGTIKAYIEGAEKNNLVVIGTGGKPAFDPNKLTDADIGKLISFTINDQYSDASIKVYKKPIISLVEESIEYSEDGLSATVKVKINGEIPSDATVTILASDGGTPELASDNTFTHVFVIDDETLASSFDVIIGNGDCSVQKSIGIKYEEAIVPTLKITEKKCINPASSSPVNILPTISPTGAILTIQNAGLTGIEIVNNKVRIQPNEFTAFGQAIHFNVDGIPMAETLTIGLKPKLDILPTSSLVFTGQDKVTVTFQHVNLNSFVESAYSFKWTIQNQTYTTRTARHTFENLQNDNNRAFVIKLIVENESCSGSASLDFKLEKSDLSDTSCTKKGNANLERDLTTVLNLKFQSDPGKAFQKSAIEFYNFVFTEYLAFLHGMRNSELVLMITMIKKLQQEIIGISDGHPDKKLLIQLWTLLARMFYIIINCQKKAVVSESPIINEIIDLIKQGYAGDNRFISASKLSEFLSGLKYANIGAS